MIQIRNRNKASPARAFLFLESCMRPLTEQQLLRILPNARPVAGVFVPALNRAMSRFKIDSPVRRNGLALELSSRAAHALFCIGRQAHEMPSVAPDWRVF